MGHIMERYQCAEEWIREAGNMLKSMQMTPVDIAEKTGHNDIVTKFDKEIETYLRSKILDAFPEDRIVGEELPAAMETKGEAVWYIDPIDGTTNFVNQRSNYAISVGCVIDERADFGIVFDVEGDRFYSAKAGEGAFLNGRRIYTAETEYIREMLLTIPCVTDAFLTDHERRDKISKLSLDVRAVRSLGSVALEICQVAEGKADLCISIKSCPWDHNAARLILTEAGGEIRRLDGAELPFCENSSIIAGSSESVIDRIFADYLD